MERPSSEELFDRFERFCYGIAGKYSSKTPQLADDLRGAAVVGLLEAAERFDWAASDSYYGFPSYARLCIKAECRDLLASCGYATSGSRRQLGQGTLHSSASLDVLDLVPADVDDDGFGLDEVVDGVVAQLSPQQREAFELAYEMGLSDTEAADVLGVSRQAFAQRRVAVIEKLRAATLPEEK
jgi:RNA polymerase sigma factor (sigma-70 family)